MSTKYMILGLVFLLRTLEGEATVVTPLVGERVRIAIQEKSVLANQQKILKSGFLAHTELSLVTDTFILRTSCEIRWDAWQQPPRFQLQQLKSGLKKSGLSGLNELIPHCFTLEVSKKELQSASDYHLLLRVEQNTPEQMQKIRQEVIKKQSPLMERFFQHTLGSFERENTLELNITEQIKTSLQP